MCRSAITTAANPPAITARTASTIHIVEVRRQRSTRTPEIRPSNSQPEFAATSVSETSRGSWVSEAASSGSAPNLIPSPRNETDPAHQTVQ